MSPTDSYVIFLRKLGSVMLFSNPPSGHLWATYSKDSSDNNSEDSALQLVVISESGFLVAMSGKSYRMDSSTPTGP